MLLGFVRTINEYLKEDALSAYMSINAEANNFELILNCNETDLDWVKAKPVAKDDIEFSVSNNVINILYPYSYEIRF